MPVEAHLCVAHSATVRIFDLKIRSRRDCWNVILALLLKVIKVTSLVKGRSRSAAVHKECQ
jgi:hypothetical protein